MAFSDSECAKLKLIDIQENIFEWKMKNLGPKRSELEFETQF